MARPTKFTPERVNVILESIRSGDPKGLAARLAGIDPITLNRWLELGEEGSADYVGFVEAYKSAEAEAEKKFVDIIRTAAATTWQAAAWMLERRFGDSWLKRTIAEQPRQPDKEAEPPVKLPVKESTTYSWPQSGTA